MEAQLIGQEIDHMILMITLASRQLSSGQRLAEKAKSNQFILGASKGSQEKDAYNDQYASHLFYNFSRTDLLTQKRPTHYIVFSYFFIRKLYWRKGINTEYYQ